LLAELDKRQAIVRTNEASRRDLESAESELLKIHGLIDAKSRNLALMKSEYSKTKDTIAGLRPAVDGLIDPDVDQARGVLELAESVNLKVRQNQIHKAVADDLALFRDRHAMLTRSIEKCDERKAEMIVSAKYPVDGLVPDDDGVTLNGVPFEQASHAEQLQCSVSIGIALNPKLKVLLVRDGSALDPKSLDVIMKTASDAGAQLWIERVGHGDECTVIIDDGQVRGGEDD
jgi:hypothetical protein